MDTTLHDALLQVAARARVWRDMELDGHDVDSVVITAALDSLREAVDDLTAITGPLVPTGGAA